MQLQGVGTWHRHLADRFAAVCLCWKLRGFATGKIQLTLHPGFLSPNYCFTLAGVPTSPITSISHLLASTLITELRSQIFKKIFIYLIRMVFGMHVCLCEGVESIGIRVTDSC